MLCRHLGDSLGDLRDLRPGGARQVEGVGDERVQFAAGQLEARIGGQPVQEVIDLQSLPHLQRDSDGVFLDGLVGLLAAHSLAHRRHQHLRRGQERQVTVQFGGDHLREGPEVREDRQESLEQPATRRTTEQETSPSFHWSPASSPTIDT